MFMAYISTALPLPETKLFLWSHAMNLSLLTLNKDNVNSGNTNWSEEKIVTVVIAIFYFKQLQINAPPPPQSFRTSTGFEPMASALALFFGSIWIAYIVNCNNCNLQCKQLQRPWVWIPLKSWNFFQVNLQLLKLQLPLQWSYLHLNLYHCRQNPLKISLLVLWCDCLNETTLVLFSDQIINFIFQFFAKYWI